LWGSLLPLFLFVRRVSPGFLFPNQPFFSLPRTDDKPLLVLHALSFFSLFDSAEPTKAPSPRPPVSLPSCVRVAELLLGRVLFPLKLTSWMGENGQGHVSIASVVTPCISAFFFFASLGGGRSVFPTLALGEGEGLPALRSFLSFLFGFFLSLKAGGRSSFVRWRAFVWSSPLLSIALSTSLPNRS